MLLISLTWFAGLTLLCTLLKPHIHGSHTHTTRTHRISQLSGVTTVDRWWLFW